MANQLHTHWPPAYNLRLSSKARHAHLKVIPNKGLEIVIPKRLQKYFKVEELLAEKKAWIEKHLAKLTITPLKYIYSLNLQAIDQVINVEYKQTDSKTIRSILLPGSNNMVLYGDVANIAHTHRYLQTWLKKHAQLHLLPWLKLLSQIHELPYNNAQVRAQRTLWGSCNAHKNISLNYKLLFVPKACAEHVMLHELVHTKYLNHSKRFWSLLAQLDPNTAAHNKIIREGDNFIPFGL